MVAVRKDRLGLRPRACSHLKYFNVFTAIAACPARNRASPFSPRALALRDACPSSRADACNHCRIVAGVMQWWP